MSDEPAGRRIAWFNPVAGIAGDMALGALIDAGAAPDAVAAALDGLAIDGYELRFEEVSRAGIRATHAVVQVAADEHHRRAGDVLALIDAGALSASVAASARRVFELLAVAEAGVHGVDPADVEFHEVGAVDSIVDIVGTCAALDSLGIDVVASAPLGLGAGAVSSAHGRIPGPAPGTMAVLAEAGVPVRGIDTDFETTTPTGAAIVAALGERYGAMPALTPHAVGYGAGTADPDGRANVLQVVIGVEPPAHAESPGTPGLDSTTEPMTLLETNLDDITGEVLAHAAAQLLEAGARDVWVTPIVMKKGRSAQQLSVLCAPGDAARLRQRIVVETGTFGVRSQQVDRLAVSRTMETVELDGDPLRVKRTPTRDKPEFADAERIATARRRPVREVLAAAEALLSRASRRSTR